MPMSWAQRLSRLSHIVGTNVVADDEERQGRILDEYLVSAESSLDRRHSEVDALRFNDDDLIFIGKLAVGQFGVVDVVRCRLDSRVYARKTIEKRAAMRAKGQCSPQIEREILVNALLSDTVWAPHILCAFQTKAALKFVMQYADGGSLWDVIESSSESKISETELRWWAPQIVSAIEWCHSQGFVHRDIKPHNFVLTPTSHLLLVDFGSAAPLLPPLPSGVQLVPQEHCLVPCGTCDYISPEILQCHEEALVALELDEEDTSPADASRAPVGGYGRETDWWSFGAMLYEMTFGVAPFFADDVGHTYIKIIEHRTSLKFSATDDISSVCVDLFKGVLCDKENRLGRHSVTEIKTHDFFNDVDWEELHKRSPPPNLHLPQFTYSASAAENLEADVEQAQEDGGAGEPETEQFTQPFMFSALFRSSKSASALSTSHVTPKGPSQLSNHASDAFVGFSWGPRLNAFILPQDSEGNVTRRPTLHREPVQLTPEQFPPLRMKDPLTAQSAPAISAFRTPVRANTVSLGHGHTFSIPRSGTARRMQGRRPLTDREAMRQLVDCVGMSARKKVLESGKKPSHLHTIFDRLSSRKPLIIHTRAESSTTSSSSDCQPPSPTPRPGSALSRRSGWGGRSTPSLMTGRSTPTLTYTGTRTTSSGIGTSNTGPDARIPHFTETETRSASYDEKLLDTEQRHARLLSELASLEQSIESLRLRRDL